MTENTVLTKNNLTSALDLRITMFGHSGPKDYRRELELETGIVHTRCVVETNSLYLSKFSASPEQMQGGRYYTPVRFH